MVKQSLKGISMDDLGGAQKAAISRAAEMAATGTDNSYIRSTFTPDDGRCMCLFPANSDTEVRRLNDEADISYNSVVKALDLTP